MDSAHKSERKFPSHTTAELKASITHYRTINPVLAESMQLEVDRREAGLSKPFVTPQI